MCRSIKTLRPPFADDVTDDDIHAAALQYVRKVAGMRVPSAANREAFDHAVAEIAHATAHLLEDVVVRPAPPRAARAHPAPERRARHDRQAPSDPVR
jgi:hypothetical protein